MCPWLAAELQSPKTPVPIAKEAACALGKILVPESRAALTKYLTEAPMTSAAAIPAGEALLSLGRFAKSGDVTPIVRWTSSKDVEVRWRAAVGAVPAEGAVGDHGVASLVEGPVP